MKIILYKFEKQIIHFLNCDFEKNNLKIGHKDKVVLTATKTKGETYQLIMDTLQKISTRYPFDLCAYHAALKYRGAIKDEESYANAAMLHLFCTQQSFELIELNTLKVKEVTGFASKDLKTRLEKEKNDIIKQHDITKSDKLLDGLALLKLLKAA